MLEWKINWIDTKGTLWVSSLIITNEFIFSLFESNKESSLELFISRLLTLLLVVLIWSCDDLLAICWDLFLLWSETFVELKSFWSFVCEKILEFSGVFWSVSDKFVFESVLFWFCCIGDWTLVSLKKCCNLI